MELLLKNHFGYDHFRPMQLDIINNVLQKKDTLVLMPTGGGKSICYQMPALQLEGLTIVISPLISLMKDQVDNLKINGINAEYINSTLLPSEIESIKERIKRKVVKLLYIAPERLALKHFKEFLLSLQISLIAIDEAHCISEWGHDFRKDYANLKFLKTTFRNVPIIALTATATLKVRDDILKQLSLEGARTFISSFNRENLNLMVMEKKKAFNKIVSLIKKHENESVIIYCFSRKDTEKIAGQLKDNGYEALSYHAGLSNSIRKRNQDLFIKDKVNIMVATIAFGMGIDKPDIRLVIHHTFSKSLEGYYQEIGRAGRDGLSSDCVLFYSKGDRRKHGYFLDRIYDGKIKRGALDKLNKMMAYCEDTSCRRRSILGYFGETYLEKNCNGCDVCLDIPEIKSTVVEKVKQKRSFDSALFEKLRGLRRRIANERNVPPFMVFGDVSLREMSTNFPRDNTDFLSINGVGQKKLNDFGRIFLEVINHHDGGDVAPRKRSNYHERLGQIKEKFSNAYEPWKDEEDDKLRQLYSINCSMDTMSQVLKRQPGAIRSRLKKQGLE